MTSLMTIDTQALITWVLTACSVFQNTKLPREKTPVRAMLHRGRCTYTPVPSFDNCQKSTSYICIEIHQPSCPKLSDGPRQVVCTALNATTEAIDFDGSKSTLQVSTSRTPVKDVLQGEREGEKGLKPQTSNRQYTLSAPAARFRRRGSQLADGCSEWIRNMASLRPSCASECCEKIQHPGESSRYRNWKSWSTYIENNPRGEGSSSFCPPPPRMLPRTLI